MSGRPVSTRADSWTPGSPGSPSCSSRRTPSGASAVAGSGSTDRVSVHSGKPSPSQTYSSRRLEPSPHSLTMASDRVTRPSGTVTSWKRSSPSSSTTPDSGCASGSPSSGAIVRYATDPGRYEVLSDTSICMPSASLVSSALSISKNGHTTRERSQRSDGCDWHPTRKPAARMDRSNIAERGYTTLTIATPAWRRSKLLLQSGYSAMYVRNESLDAAQPSASGGSKVPSSVHWSASTERRTRPRPPLPPEPQTPLPLVPPLPPIAETPRPPPHRSPAPTGTSRRRIHRRHRSCRSRRLRSHPGLRRRGWRPRHRR